VLCAAGAVAAAGVVKLLVVQSLLLLGEMLQQLLLLMTLEQLLDGKGLDDSKGAGAWDFDQVSMVLGVPKGLDLLIHDKTL
jgi:hypothetical protein